MELQTEVTRGDYPGQNRIRSGINAEGDSLPTMQNGHFILPVEIDLAATFVFGLTGALAAMKRGYDWIGLFALAFATAVGGGLVRDGLFISQGPAAITKDSRYIIVVLVAALAAPLFRSHLIRYNKLIAWLDALGLGAYAVVGIEKSINAELSIAAAVLVGVINAVGGGVLRDILVREEPLLFKPGQFYALAAIAGCLLYVLLAIHFRIDVVRAALITIGATFAFRVLAIRFNWKTKPVWEADASKPSL